MKLPNVDSSHGAPLHDTALPSSSQYEYHTSAYHSHIPPLRIVESGQEDQAPMPNATLHVPRPTHYTATGSVPVILTHPFLPPYTVPPVDLLTNTPLTRSPTRDGRTKVFLPSSLNPTEGTSVQLHRRTWAQISRKPFSARRSGVLPVSDLSTISSQFPFNVDPGNETLSANDETAVTLHGIYSNIAKNSQPKLESQKASYLTTPAYIPVTLLHRFSVDEQIRNSTQAKTIEDEALPIPGYNDKLVPASPNMDQLSPFHYTEKTPNPLGLLTAADHFISDAPNVVTVGILSPSPQPTEPAVMSSLSMDDVSYATTAAQFYTSVLGVPSNIDRSDRATLSSDFHEQENSVKSVTLPINYLNSSLVPSNLLRENPVSSSTTTGQYKNNTNFYLTNNSTDTANNVSQATVSSGLFLSVSSESEATTVQDFPSPTTGAVTEPKDFINFNHKFALGITSDVTNHSPAVHTNQGTTTWPSHVSNTGSNRQGFKTTKTRPIDNTLSLLPHGDSNVVNNVSYPVVGDTYSTNSTENDFQVTTSHVNYVYSLSPIETLVTESIDSTVPDLIDTTITEPIDTTITEPIDSAVTEPIDTPLNNLFINPVTDTFMMNQVSDPPINQATDHTINPVRDPTINPVRDPAINPVRDPTINPVRDPTINPVRDPTINPVRDPTIDPVRDPTIDPVRDPTMNPVRDPTMNPVSDPTINPVSDPINPVSDPTINPVSDPTINPVSDPTINPVSDPTINPVSDPTINPVSDPTINPVSDPTINPVSDPTINPVSDPTINPVSDPTINPVSDPTINPVTDPTINPVTDSIINSVTNTAVSPTDPILPNIVDASSTSVESSTFLGSKANVTSQESTEQEHTTQQDIALYLGDPGIEPQEQTNKTSSFGILHTQSPNISNTIINPAAETSTIPGMATIGDGEILLGLEFERLAKSDVTGSVPISPGHVDRVHSTTPFYFSTTEPVPAINITDFDNTYGFPPLTSQDASQSTGFENISKLSPSHHAHLNNLADVDLHSNNKALGGHGNGSSGVGDAAQFWSVAAILIICSSLLLVLLLVLLLLFMYRRSTVSRKVYVTPSKRLPMSRMDDFDKDPPFIPFELGGSNEVDDQLEGIRIGKSYITKPMPPAILPHEMQRRPSRVPTAQQLPPYSNCYAYDGPQQDSPSKVSQLRHDYDYPPLQRTGAKPQHDPGIDRVARRGSRKKAQSPSSLSSCCDGSPYTSPHLVLPTPPYSRKGSVTTTLSSDHGGSSCTLDDHELQGSGCSVSSTNQLHVQVEVHVDSDSSNGCSGLAVSSGVGAAAGSSLIPLETVVLDRLDGGYSSPSVRGRNGTKLQLTGEGNTGICSQGPLLNKGTELSVLEPSEGRSEASMTEGRRESKTGDRRCLEPCDGSSSLLKTRGLQLKTARPLALLVYSSTGEETTLVSPGSLLPRVAPPPYTTSDA